MRLHKHKSKGLKIKNNHTKGWQKFSARDGQENVGIWRERKHRQQWERRLIFFIWRTSKVEWMCSGSDYLEKVSVSPSFIHWHRRGFFFFFFKQSGSPLIEQMLTPNNLPPETLYLMLQKNNNKIKQNKRAVHDPLGPHAAIYWL